MNKNHRYQTQSVVSCRCVSSSYYEVFNPDINTVVPINQTGKDIVDFLKKPHSFDELCSHLKDIYDIDLATVKQDTILFLKEMQPDFIQEISV